MGMRANLVVIEEEGYSLYYSHWCANTLPSDLFWGPNASLKFIQKQRPMPDKNWLDTIWAEGGVVYDDHQQILLFYGGEDILFDIPLRNLYLEIMQHNWPGWELRWAHQGIVDLAAYVGISAEKVYAPDELDKQILDGQLDTQTSFAQKPVQKRWISTIGTVKFEDKTVWVFPISLVGNQSWRYLAQGSKLLKFTMDRRVHQSVDLNEWATHFPVAGFHLDESSKTLTLWHANEMYISPQRASVWEGWQIKDIGDNYLQHLSLAEGAFQFPKVDEEKLLEQLIKILLPSTKNHPMASLKALLALQEDEGWEIEVNKLALEHHPQQISYETKMRILNYAISAWHAEKES